MKKTGASAAFHAALSRHPLAVITAAALLLCVASEALARRSLLSALSFFAAEPAAALLNAAIIFFLLSLSLLFRRRMFVFLFVCALVLGFSAANFIMQSFRTAPLTAADFALIGSVGSIISKYLSPRQTVLLFAAAAAAIALTAVGFRLCPKASARAKCALPVLLCACAVIAAGFPAVYATAAPPESRANALETSEAYGYPVCFVMSIFDRGIDRPIGYSENSVDAILAELRTREATESLEHPNIIFLQLESFFDVNELVGLDVPGGALPVFSRLEADFPSGDLAVPSLATGTANTEFEVLTGMARAYFGVGEYPYSTVLHERACESIAYNMRALGYTAHAIHDHAGDFYDRNIVFSNLGFDTFTSVEYMRGVEYNENGWARDKVLTAEILRALGSTPGEDLIYAISVQAHGHYPDGDNMPDISAEFDEASFEYYLSQIQEMDTFLGELTGALERYGRPVVLVMFGDHLPGLGFKEGDLRDGDLYETQYVIWSNFGLEAPDRDIAAYQLSAYVQSLLGMDSGTFTKLHQQLAGTAGYLRSLELLQYDFLYGDLEAFGGVDPYEPTQLRMGAVPVRCTEVTQGPLGITVYGSGFTEFSRVYINDREQPCELSDGALTCPGVYLEDGDCVRVAQVSAATGDVLSSTKSLVWQE